MSDLYLESHRSLQDRYDTRRLADKAAEFILHDAINEEERAFIESRDMFFLSTVNDEGWPTCSYKGGKPGFVRVVDEHTIAFPSYNGNGMYLSLGNINGSRKIGMLFIDFENPHRLRLHGQAEVIENDPLLPEYHEAELIVRVRVENLFINCPRYIHRYRKLEESEYVPNPGCETPLPDWKRIPEIEEVLPESDRARLRREAGER